MKPTALAACTCAFLLWACKGSPVAGSLEVPAANEGSDGSSTDAGSDVQSEDARAVEPTEVTGAFLTCDEADVPGSDQSKVYLGCTAYDAQGVRIPVEPGQWSVRGADGRDVSFTVEPSDSSDWTAYVVFDEALLGQVSVEAAPVKTKHGASFVTTVRPASGTGLDADLGASVSSLCRGGFAALAVKTKGGACEDGAAVVAVNDGKDLKFSCCSLPDGALRSEGRNAEREAGCKAGEVQTGFTEDRKALCSRLDTDAFALSAAHSAVYISAKAGAPVGVDTAVASDLLGYLSRSKDDDSCVCPDLRMVLAGGHDDTNNRCTDRCVLLLPIGDAGAAPAVLAPVTGNGNAPVNNFTGNSGPGNSGKKPKD